MSTSSVIHKAAETVWIPSTNGIEKHTDLTPIQEMDLKAAVIDDPLDAEARPLGPFTVLDMEVYLDEYEYVVELYNGWLVWQQTTDIAERMVVSNLQGMLDISARKVGFGQVLPDQTEYRLDEGNDIIPDAALVSWKRLEEDFMIHGPNNRRLLIKCPELIIESRSPSNWRKQERLKREEYFKNGTEVVWDVDEPNKRIYVYRKEDPGNPEVYNVDDVIECKPFLPKWKRNVADIFAERTSAEVVVGEVAEEWRAEGHEEGHREGIKEGHREGHREGVKEGQNKKALEIAQSLLDLLDDQTISEKTELPLDIIMSLRSSSE